MTSAALNQFLAALTSFSRDTAPKAPPALDWEELAELAERHGLAGILSYQLDYRFLARVRVPPAVRDRLRSSFNAIVNDNVLKVTQLRRLLSEEGMPAVVVLGGAALADALYAHLAFRPIDDLGLWVPAADLSAAAAAFAEGGLSLASGAGGRPSRSLAARLASPDIELALWKLPLGLPLTAPAANELWAAKLPVRAFGPKAYRLAPADAVLAQLASLSAAGFAVPRLWLVDLREMALKADDQRPEGFYGLGDAGLRAAEVIAKARPLGLSRALWAGFRLVQELFPEARAQAERLLPPLPARAARLVEEAVVQPALDPRRTQVLRPVVALRRVLLA